MSRIVLYFVCTHLKVLCLATLIIKAVHLIPPDLWDQKRLCRWRILETAKSSTTTSIALTTASTTTSQSWRVNWVKKQKKYWANLNPLIINFFSSPQIKVSQIECNSIMLAPEGCTQYFTEDQGTIYSYGYGTPIELQVPFIVKVWNCLKLQRLW